MLYTGIDLHKRFSHLTTVDEKGMIIKQEQINNEPMNILNYFWSMNDDHKAVVESTIGWYWIADLLNANNISVVLANPRSVKAISTAKVKTDKCDSTTLAHLLRTDYIPEAHQINPELRDKRDLLRSRLNLIQRKIRAVNNVHCLLQKFNLTDPNDLPGLYQYQYQMYDQQVDFLHKQIKELEKTIYPLIIDNDDVQRLLAVPGIGILSACTLHLEVGDFTRFPTEKHFFSYCRVVPGASNSGGKTSHNSKQSKAGNKYLKIVFNDAAVSAYKHYPVVRDFYNKKCRKKNKHLARNLVAKELARIAYHITIKKCDYDNTFKGKELTHIKKWRWARSTSPGMRLVAV